MELKIFICPKCNHLVALKKDVEYQKITSCPNCSFTDYIRKFDSNYVDYYEVGTVEAFEDLFQEIKSLCIINGCIIPELHDETKLSDCIKRMATKYNVPQSSVAELFNVIIKSFKRNTELKCDPRHFVLLDETKVDAKTVLDKLEQLCISINNLNEQRKSFSKVLYSETSSIVRKSSSIEEEELLKLQNAYKNLKRKLDRAETILKEYHLDNLLKT